MAPSSALAGTGLKVGDLASGATRVSYRQVEKVFRNAIQLSHGSDIAFRAGQRMHVNAYGMYGYALLSSPTRAEGIDFTAKYGRALGMVAEVVFSRDDETATYTFKSVLSRDPSDDLYRFALEFALAT
ncbi:MAG: AraC family transcriptional regulator ligand-binding domain-containing protein, partial [Rhizobiales bacterium]|nr:AraC family transcriptional regulator ligand-binding domain-containing protein [Hyphomicrobiales bacterium]